MCKHNKHLGACDCGEHKGWSEQDETNKNDKASGSDDKRLRNETSNKSRKTGEKKKWWPLQILKEVIMGKSQNRGKKRESSPRNEQESNRSRFKRRRKGRWETDPNEYSDEFSSEEISGDSQDTESSEEKAEKRNTKSSLELSKWINNMAPNKNYAKTKEKATDTEPSKEVVDSPKEKETDIEGKTREKGKSDQKEGKQSINDRRWAACAWKMNSGQGENPEGTIKATKQGWRQARSALGPFAVGEEPKEIEKSGSKLVVTQREGISKKLGKLKTEESREGDGKRVIAQRCPCLGDSGGDTIEVKIGVIRAEYEFWKNRKGFEDKLQMPDAASAKNSSRALNSSG